MNLQELLRRIKQEKINPIYPGNIWNNDSTPSRCKSNAKFVKWLHLQTVFVGEDFSSFTSHPWVDH